MRYLVRLVVYAAIFFLTFSVSYVALMRFVPATITPIKIFKLFENVADYGVIIDSRWKSMGSINPEMPRAVMASEDNNYLIHYGFDWDAINKAIKNNKRGRRLRGASTISQQTAKNMFCVPDRTWVRKAFEAYYTVLIETMWSKRRIMEVYLNVIEVYPNTYGVQAAAKRFFKKDAAKLNRHETSMIACVLPNPLRMNLARPSSYMVGRSSRIRNNMRKLPQYDYSALKRDKENLTK